MAGRGPLPKSDDTRRRANPPTYGWFEIENVPFEDAPRLVGTFPAPTRRWWAAVSSMPHCVLWYSGDWQFAMDTARVHSLFMQKRVTSIAAELRTRERVMGTTYEARQRLRIRYVDPRPELAVVGTSMDEYRRMLQEPETFERERRRRLLEEDE